MASTEAAEEAISKAIETIATRVSELAGTIGSGAVDIYASAVNQLAEARAWLRSPNNSHGGGGTS
jgi:hypothetical protein